MFYFQQLLNQGLAGIDRTGMIPAIVGMGYTILLVGFLIGLYQAVLRGGDVQSLAVTGMKYLAIAIILANWSSVFREVNDSFNQVAQFIDNSSGAGDMFLSWMDQLKQQFAGNGISAFLPAVAATFAAITTALLLLAAYLIYALMVVVFAFFYVLYGCVLYVLGPLVLALLPMAGVGQLAKTYATNLMIWNAWGILYATFGSLITAIQFNRVDQVTSQGFLKGFFLGSSDSTILGLVSIFYALALGLIPFIAKRIITGDVGSSAYALLRAGAVAVGRGRICRRCWCWCFGRRSRIWCGWIRCNCWAGRSSRQCRHDVFIHAAAAAESCRNDSFRHDERRLRKSTARPGYCLECCARSRRRRTTKIGPCGAVQRGFRSRISPCGHARNGRVPCRKNGGRGAQE
jgi:hypothetical protein